MKRPDFATPDELGAWLCAVVARTLDLAPDAVSPRAAFVELGLDSMSAVTLAAELESGLGRSVDPALLWDYPSLQDLAGHLWTLGRNPLPLEAS